MASIPSYAKRGQPLMAIKGSVPSLENLPTGCRFHTRCAHVFERCKVEHPELQGFEHGSVRCHWYPEHSILPILQQKIAVMPEKTEPQMSISSAEIPAILTVDKLCVHFKVGAWYSKDRKIIKAVDNLSFQLEKGQTLALVGESGCGKTTASRAILRLISKTSGSIHYQGKAVERFHGNGLKAYHQGVQIIFQDPYTSMNPRLSVGEILAEGMIAHGIRGTAIEALQWKLLDQVNLPKSSLDRYPYQFSGGQRQRICIARALALEPQVLICDEPTSALDLSVQAQILNLLKELQREMGIAYLFITHNMAAVAYLADAILVMKNGQMVESGTVEQVLKHPKEEYTQLLLRSAHA